MLVKRIVVFSVFGLLQFCAFSKIRQPQVQSSAGFQPVNIPTSQPTSYPQQNGQITTK